MGVDINTLRHVDTNTPSKEHREHILNFARKQSHLEWLFTVVSGSLVYPQSQKLSFHQGGLQVKIICTVYYFKGNFWCYSCFKNIHFLVSLCFSMYVSLLQVSPWWKRLLYKSHLCCLLLFSYCLTKGIVYPSLCSSFPSNHVPSKKQGSSDECGLEHCKTDNNQS